MGSIPAYQTEERLATDEATCVLPELTEQTEQAGEETDNIFEEVAQIQESESEHQTLEHLATEAAQTAQPREEANSISEESTHLQESEFGPEAAYPGPAAAYIRRESACIRTEVEELHRRVEEDVGFGSDLSSIQISLEMSEILDELQRLNSGGREVAIDMSWG